MDPHALTRLKRHFKRLFRHPQRLVIAVCVAVCTLFLLSLGWLEMNKVARRKINEQMLTVQRRLGVPVEVGRLSIGFGSATFEDLRVGAEADVVVSRITAEIGLNPFSANFGELDGVTVYRVKIKSPVSKVQGSVRRLGDQNLLATDVGESGAAAQKSIEKLFRALPTERLAVRSGGIDLVDDDGKPQLQVRGLELLIDRRARKVLFKIANAKNAAGRAESFLQGRFELSPKQAKDKEKGGDGNYRFFVRRKLNGKPDKQGKNGNAWAVSGEVTKDLTVASVRFDARTLPSFVVPYAASILGDKPVARLSGEATLTRTGEAYDVDLNLRSAGLRVSTPLLSAQPVGPIRFTVAAQGLFRPENRLFAIEAATIELPARTTGVYGERPVRLTASGALRLPTERQPGVALQGQMQLPPTDCQTALDASPPALLPALEEFKLAGQIEGGIDFNFDSSRQDSVYFEVHKPRFNCRVKSEPFVYSAEHLAGPFTLVREVDKGGTTAPSTDKQRERGVESGPLADKGAGAKSEVQLTLSPHAPGFTPLIDIAGSVNLAFVASEDQGFYNHRGIDVFALENAVHRNFREGKVKVGGSTITMQTVKNLFLTHDRTIARKLQELFLAWHLEQVLSKERILEIYLNIVEFGPGIYGITDASQHFFGKQPFDLTLTESAYLALLLPSPKSRYLYFCRGELTPAFHTLLSGLLKRMLNLGRINFERYQQAMASPIHFNNIARAAADTGCARFGGTAALDDPTLNMDANDPETYEETPR